MQHAVRLAMIGALAFAGAASAAAQQPPTGAAGRQDRPPMQQRAREPRGSPTFTVFGLPVWLVAPVAKPYCNCVAENFGGQPQRSRDAVMRAAGGIGE